jgi:hypothetical protein
LLSNYLDDEEYRRLQSLLAANPLLGDVMPGTGGFRKLRWADPGRGKGRRGGTRIIYYHFLTDRLIWFMTIYDKDEASDLTSAEKKALKAAIDVESDVRRKKRDARHNLARRGK